ncbi:MAG: DUF3617 domain-containing protein [Proteobacteria bacterium]|nr:DUF3617 domain-containing protein [Pseudomonadota bacterium]MBU1057312.1 DUF3617 domain-containing protein [Pseudomonadota bacterium]
MKKTWLALTLGFLGCGAVAFAAGSINMEEGLWEISSTINMPGMIMPPTTFTQCISKEELVPHNHQPGQDCTMDKVIQQGDRVTWTLRCDTPGGTMHGQGSITYKGTTFSGDMKMLIDAHQGMHMNSRMEGRRIGPCP